MAYLEPVHLEPLWYVSTNKDTLIWLAFFLVHLVAWLLLYATCIIMDFPEMVGIRQVVKMLFIVWCVKSGEIQFLDLGSAV